MPFYQNLKPQENNENENIANKRTLEGILRLRTYLQKKVPVKTHSRNILLATWNIRDFDKLSWGKRLEESYYYIAEIISHFDIISIQEVYKDLHALNKVMKILGSSWDYIFSDTTEGYRGGSERMAFIYDKKKVQFGGLAGELVIPPMVKKDKNGKLKYTEVSQVWRTPLLCGFKSEWMRFIICSVHIQWGESKAEPEKRVEEIQHIAKFLKKRSEDPTSWARKIILLGDFNIFDIEDKTYESLAKEGYEYPDVLAGVYRKNFGTNTSKRKRHFDHILFRGRQNKFEVRSGGVLDLLKIIFRDEEEEIYKPLMIKPKKEGSTKVERYSNYKQWRTFQISDHNPLWVEFKVDFSEEYLQGLLKGHTNL